MDGIYFAICWWQIQPTVSYVLIAFGGGHQPAQPIRDSDGPTYPGMNAETNADGTVTDVVLAFGAATPSRAAHVAVTFLPLRRTATTGGRPTADTAVALHSKVLAVRAHAGATIHVAGHRREMTL